MKLKEMKKNLSALFNKEVEFLDIHITPISPYSEHVIVLITFADGTQWDTFFELDSKDTNNENIFNVVKSHFEYQFTKN